MPAGSANVHLRAEQVLHCREPERKCELAFVLWQDWQSGSVGAVNCGEPSPIGEPGRPEYPLLVHPSKLRRRSFHTRAGRLSLMHAVAHIEFNAINLACDAVYRYRDMPVDYYCDWIRVAADEARHFQLVLAYLHQGDCRYGDFPAHNGLWHMAVQTADDHLARMAVVPRVLEARGLDVTPAMIEALSKVDDEPAAEILSTIYQEEIAHVAAGSRWFRYLCERDGLDPERHFFYLLGAYAGATPRPPFNLAARRQGGFSDSELAMLESFECE